MGSCQKVLPDEGGPCKKSSGGWRGGGEACNFQMTLPQIPRAPYHIKNEPSLT